MRIHLGLESRSLVQLEAHTHTANLRKGWNYPFQLPCGLAQRACHRLKTEGSFGNSSMSPIALQDCPDPFLSETLSVAIKPE